MNHSVKDSSFNSRRKSYGVSSVGTNRRSSYPFVLGCLTFGWTTPQEEAFAIVDRALDAGVNFLDTANTYGRGTSEEVTGQNLKRNGKRQQVVLATKVHGRMNDDDPNAAGNSRRHTIEQCEASLHRLQTGYIDLYQIHCPRPDIPIDETLRALDDLIRAGKVRYIGSSTFVAWQLMESLWVSKELGLNRFICEQPPYNHLDRRIEQELLPMAQTYGIAIIPWSPLGGGLLTGKYQRNTPPPADSRYADRKGNPRFTDQAFDIVERLRPLASEKGCTLSQLSLAWCFSQPTVTSSIAGPRTMDQLNDNLGALEVRLTAEDKAKIDEVAPPGRMASPFYEAEFGPHFYR